MSPGPVRTSILIGIILVLMLCAIYFGLTTTIDRSPILGSEIARASESLLREEAVRIGALRPQHGTLRLGWAHASITPRLGTPTYGYSARRARGVIGINDSVYVYALALSAGDSQPVVFLTADICTWVDDISNRITAELASLVTRKQIYFAVTHTHSGPGGYARGPIDAWLMGGLDVGQCDMLVHAAVEATTKAIYSLEPGAYRELVTRLPACVVNRIEPDDPVDDELLLVEYKKDSGALCAFVSYCAHATTIGPKSVVCSGDYPAIVRNVLLQHGYSEVLFVSSSTGQAGPALDGVRVSNGNVEDANRYGSAVTERLVALAAESAKPFMHNIEITSFMSTVALPRYQYRVAGRILRPWIIGWLIGTQNARALVQAFRLDGSLYISHSFEFSGVIARRLKQFKQIEGRHLFITGLNGTDYLYVVPEEYYDRETYEASLSLFGPHLGSYLEKITAQLSSFMFSLGTPEEVSFNLSN